MSRDWLFALVITTICIGLYFVDLARIPAAPIGIHARGRVIAVDNSHVRTNLIVKTESQFLTVKLLDGPHRGRELAVTNMLSGKMEFDEFYEAGATVLVEYDAPDGQPRNGMARGFYRLRMQLILIGLFALLLIGVAGVTGLKALLSFVFTAMVLWKVFFPLILRGFAPLPTGMAMVGIFTAVITFSVGGMNRRGMATFAGSMLGVSLTCLLAVLFTRAFALHGAVRPLPKPFSIQGIMICGSRISSLPGSSSPPPGPSWTWPWTLPRPWMKSNRKTRTSDSGSTCAPASGWAGPSSAP